VAVSVNVQFMNVMRIKLPVPERSCANHPIEAQYVNLRMQHVVSAGFQQRRIQ
jgi:hypothetical protein